MVQALKMDYTMSLKDTEVAVAVEMVADRVHLQPRDEFTKPLRRTVERTSEHFFRCRTDNTNVRDSLIVICSYLQWF